MKWHEMTGPEVHELAKTTDLAVLPIGSLETHGPHLPNGSDSFIAERVCELIAEEVPCIVLPTLYYNICAQMKSFPGGAISIPPQVMIQLYDAIFSECARLGFRKIFAAVCHGGSETPVEFLANMVHERATSEVPGKPAKPDYYLFSKTLSPGAAAAKYAKDPVLEVGHGGEIETALNMACRPDLVHMDRVTEDGPTNPGRSRPTITSNGSSRCRWRTSGTRTSHRWIPPTRSWRRWRRTSSRRRRRSRPTRSGSTSDRASDRPGWNRTGFCDDGCRAWGSR